MAALAKARAMAPAELPPVAAAAVGGLVFWAPVNGVTTPNSPHARTELGRMEQFAAGTGAHTLTHGATDPSTWDVKPYQP